MAQAQMPLQAVATSLGVATVTLPPLALGRKWVITQINVQSNSATQTACDLKRNGIIVTSSVAANSDTAGGEPPVEYKAGDQVQVVWTGATVGARCTATIYYDEESVRRS